VSAEPTSRELELVLQRFFALTPPDQLTAYRTVRDYLAGRVRQTKRDHVIAEKEAALRAIAAVAAHLNLAAGEAPTPAHFDAAARSLELGWDRNRVRRAWGRWRFAKAAFLGQRLPESTKQRDERRKIGGRWHTREGHLTGIQLWLATDPGATSSQAYRAWAREYNETLPPDALPVIVAPGAVAAALKMGWPDVIRLARGEITQAQARPPKKRRSESFCRGPHQLVSLEDVEGIVGLSRSPTRDETNRQAFPAPVVVVPGVVRLWLREHVEAYKAGRRWSPDENVQQLDSLRDVYMTLSEVKEMTGLTRGQIGTGSHDLPEPAVRAGFKLLWLRSEVEASPLVKQGRAGL